MDVLRHLRAGLLSVDFRILYHVSRFEAGLRLLLPLSTTYVVHCTQSEGTVPMMKHTTFHLLKAPSVSELLH